MTSGVLKALLTAAWMACGAVGPDGEAGATGVSNAMADCCSERVCLARIARPAAHQLHGADFVDKAEVPLAHLLQGLLELLELVQRVLLRLLVLVVVQLGAVTRGGMREASSGEKGRQAAGGRAGALILRLGGNVWASG